MFLNFKEAFTFMFKDEKFWQKYLVGTLFAMLTIIPSWIIYPKIASGTITPFISMNVSLLAMVLGLFVYGFGALYSNSKIALKQDILPEWNKDFGKIVKTGLKYIFGILLVGIAISIVFIPVIFILGIIGGILSVILPALSAIFYIFCGIPVILIWATFIFLSAVSFLTDLNFKSLFNIKRMWFIVKGNFLNLVILGVFFIAYSILTQILLKILNYNIYFLILLIFSFYIALVFHNLYAQFAIIGIENSTKRLEEKKEQENIQENSQENLQ